MSLTSEYLHPQDSSRPLLAKVAAPAQACIVGKEARGMRYDRVGVMGHRFGIYPYGSRPWLFLRGGRIADGE
jgi:hypothetical protein